MRHYREMMGLRGDLGASRSNLENYELRAQSGDALYRQESQYYRPEEEIYTGDIFGETETVPGGMVDYVYNDSARMNATGRTDDTFTNTLFAQQAPPYTGGYESGQQFEPVSRFNHENRFQPSQQYLVEEDTLRGQMPGEFMTGAGIAAGVGGLGAITNAVQGDSNGNIVFNPVTGAVASGVIGAGAGALYNSARPTNPIMDEIMQRKLDRMGEEKFGEYYGQNKERIARKERDLGIKDMRRQKRIGGRNVAIGAGAGTLLSLLSQLGSQGE